MFFIPFRNSPSLLKISKFSLTPYISLAFLLFAFYLLQLSSSLYFSRLSSPFFSLSPYLSRVSHQFSTLFLFILLMLLSRFSLISHSVLFLFLSILPSPLRVYFSSDRSSGTAIPQAIYRACCGEPRGFEIVYGAYGGIRSTVVLRACATKHHLNRPGPSAGAEISRAPLTPS